MSGAHYLKKYPKGSWIFKQGESGKTMFIIHSGKIRLTREIAGQLEEMGTLEKGDFFGEMSLLEGVSRTTSAFVEENSEIIEIDVEGFSNILKKNVEIPIRMIRKYAFRLEEMNKKFEYLLENKREYDKGIREIIDQIKGSNDVREAKVEEDSIKAHLTCENPSQKFNILGDSNLMGRVDPVTNIVPDIDLTKLDTGRTVSRRHARITCVNEDLFLVEEIGVTNGTFVNGERLTTGELKKLKNGDEISLGKVSLKLSMILG